MINNTSTLSRFETQYPVTAREWEIGEILKYVTRGQSCELISVPGAGRSTVLRLLSYHKALREHHLKEKEPHFLFVYANFSEIGSFDEKELTKFIFLQTLFALDDMGRANEEVHRLFKEVLATSDSLLQFQYFKNAVETIVRDALTPILLFDRFSEYAHKTSEVFFTNLKSLRTTSSGKLSVVFSNHKPIEKLLPLYFWQVFYEHFADHQIFLRLKDEVATNFRISLLEKEYGKTIPNDLKNILYELTAGHSKLMKLSSQLLLTESFEQPKTKVELTEYLLKSTLIKGSLMEIWQSLTKDERKELKTGIISPLPTKLQLPFPLFSEFIKRNIPDELVPKEIRLNEQTNEIYFGDEPVEGLTAYEFKMLSYLIKTPNRVCERDEIIQAVWQDSKTQEGVTDEALDQMVYRLRKKIEDEADNPRHLVTVKGRGFRFIP